MLLQIYQEIIPYAMMKAQLCWSVKQYQTQHIFTGKESVFHFSAQLITDKIPRKSLYSSVSHFMNFYS